MSQVCAAYHRGVKANGVNAMLELVRRCKHCDRSMMNVSSQDYAENPYCRHCLIERVAKAAAELPAATVKRIKGYFTRVPIDETSR